MILYEITGGEDNPVYQKLEIENGNRQYDFLRSIVQASLAVGRPFLSTRIIKALNFHAIACLHISAGEFRPCEVRVGDYHPPAAYQVPDLMADFTNEVNRHWDKHHPVHLAAYVLWRLNLIHPFINGNGRTARTACYFVICVSSGGWLPGAPILPELLRRNRAEYVEALKVADRSMAVGPVDLEPLKALLSRLLAEQLSDFVNPSPPAGDAAPAPADVAPPALPPPSNESEDR